MDAIGMDAVGKAESTQGYDSSVFENHIRTEKNKVILGIALSALSVLAIPGVTYLGILGFDAAASPLLAIGALALMIASAGALAILAGFGVIYRTEHAIQLEQYQQASAQYFPTSTQ